MTNKALIFKSIPDGAPVPGKDLAVEERPFDRDAAPPRGGLVVEVLRASFDPYLRGKMRDASVKSYTPAFALNEPMVSGIVARVLKSDAENIAEGDLIVTPGAIAEYTTIPAQAVSSVRKIQNKHNIPLGHFIGALGMPGLTAWSSLFEIGKPKKGETIFVSSAAGAVGQVVGQVAKREGLTVIGSVGSDEKLEFITKELGFDAGFNYKKETPKDALRRLVPKGIDIYYDNVGGEQLDAALELMNDHGRIVACGHISGYNAKPEERYGVKNLFMIVTKQLLFQGFLVGDKNFGPKYAKEYQEKMQQWIADGSVKFKLHTTDGIEHAAEGFVGMLEGKNFGKAVLRIRD